MQHIKRLRLAARVTRVLSILLVLLAVWTTGEMFFKSVIQVTIRFNGILGILSNVLGVYSAAVMFWVTSIALEAFAALIIDLSRRQQPPYQKTDEELFGLPKPRKPSEQVQPQRMKIENKPKLTPRLYHPRWQGGKAQRAVRKTVIE